MASESAAAAQQMHNGSPEQEELDIQQQQMNGLPQDFDGQDHMDGQVDDYGDEMPAGHGQVSSALAEQRANKKRA